MLQVDAVTLRNMMICKHFGRLIKKNLIIIGVPTNNFKQEPGSNSDIKDFCETNFGISFPMAEKTNVIGSNSHPFL